MPQTTQDCISLGLRKPETGKFVGRHESGSVTIVENRFETGLRFVPTATDPNRLEQSRTQRGQLVT